MDKCPYKNGRLCPNVNACKAMLMLEPTDCLCYGCVRESCNTCNNWDKYNVWEFIDGENRGRD